MDFHWTIGLPILFELRKYRSHMTAIVIGNQKKRRRRIGGNITLWNSERARIDHDLEIGPTLHAVDGIGGVSIASGWIVNQHRHDFATGGKSHRTDAVRVQAPFGGATADEPHSALGVLA